jgi:hypothetical protein
MVGHRFHKFEGRGHSPTIGYRRKDPPDGALQWLVSTGL